MTEDTRADAFQQNAFALNPALREGDPQEDGDILRNIVQLYVADNFSP